MDSFLEDLDGPRQKAVQAMRDCVPPDLWQRNVEYLRGLRDRISAHPVSRHPAIAAFAAGDDHQNDLWLLLTQALTPDQYPRIATLCDQYCELWDRFWTLQLTSASHPNVAAPVIA